MTSVSFRPETAEDEAFLRALYASTRTEEMAHVPWDDDQKTAFLNSQFDLQRRHYREAYPEARFDVLMQGEEPVGRLYIDRSEVIHVIDIALVPGVRGQGLGTSLFEELTHEAAAGDRCVRVHVMKGNPALRLYVRLGFREIEDIGTHHFMEWHPDRPR